MQEEEDDDSVDSLVMVARRVFEWVANQTRSRHPSVERMKNEQRTMAGGRTSYGETEQVECVCVRARCKLILLWRIASRPLTARCSLARVSGPTSQCRQLITQSE